MPTGQPADDYPDRLTPGNLVKNEHRTLCRPPCPTNRRPLSHDRQDNPPDRTTHTTLCPILPTGMPTGHPALHDALHNALSCRQGQQGRQERRQGLLPTIMPTGTPHRATGATQDALPIGMPTGTTRTTGTPTHALPCRQDDRTPCRLSCRPQRPPSPQKRPKGPQRPLLPTGTTRATETPTGTTGTPADHNADRNPHRATGATQDALPYPADRNADRTPCPPRRSPQRPLRQYPQCRQGLLPTHALLCRT